MDEKIPSFLKEDYLESAEPYTWVYNRADTPLREMQLCQLVSEKAKVVGVRNFNKLYVAYKRSIAIIEERERREFEKTISELKI